MRRFVKTILAKRVAQVTIVQDREHRRFEVFRWRAAFRSLDLLATFSYVPGNAETARQMALAEAKRALEAERVIHATPAPTVPV